MSFGLVSAQRKIADDQFIGDLMNLFERRKIQCGDPRSLETFESTLAANDAFRSQLFTLCTAISHMADADLSGEQLLALVARALGGTGMPKRNGAVEVPDGMRAAFLAGYEAWSNRGSEPREPLRWPSHAQPEQQPAAAQAAAPAEPVSPRATSGARHTVQEALDIARQRSLANPSPRPPSWSAGNLESLTLAELKRLLEDIEQRVSRIQPDPVSSVSRLLAADPGHVDPGAPHEVPQASAASAPAGKPDPTPAPAAASVAAPAFAEAHPPASPEPRPPASPERRATAVRIDEAAFLARHPYLRPARGAHLAGTHAAPAARPSPFPATRSKVAAAPQPSPAVAPAPTPIAATNPKPVAAPPSLPFPAPSFPDPLAAVTPSSPSLERPRGSVTLRIATPGLALRVALTFAVVFAGSLAGFAVYRSLHPRAAYNYPDLKTLLQFASSNAAPTADAASTPEIVLAASSDPALTLFSGPPPTAAAEPDAVQTAEPSSLPSSGSGQPLYVPSATMIDYAISSPRPAYPHDQPRGIEGTVVLQVTVSREGDVSAVHAVSGPVEMRPAAMQAVQSWRFRPYLVNGSPTAVVTTLGFLFKGQ